MALPVILEIISIIQGQRGNSQPEQIQQPQGYAPEQMTQQNQQPAAGTIRSPESNTGMYKTIGEVSGGGRQWDAGTTNSNPDQQTGNNNVMGTIGGIVGALGQNRNNQQQQAYQMPYLRR
jgi:hypothetical protein